MNVYKASLSIVIQKSFHNRSKEKERYAYKKILSIFTFLPFIVHFKQLIIFVFTFAQFPITSRIRSHNPQSFSQPYSQWWFTIVFTFAFAQFAIIFAFTFPRIVRTDTLHFYFTGVLASTFILKITFLILKKKKKKKKIYRTFQLGLYKTYYGYRICYTRTNNNVRKCFKVNCHKLINERKQNIKH